MTKRAMDHDKWLGKIHTIARAEDIDKQRDEYVAPKEERKCTNCDHMKTCKTFNGKMAFSGTFSFGGDAAANSICIKWRHQNKVNKVKNQSEIKSLMKQFKKIKR
jgi:hypothetical protein